MIGSPKNRLTRYYLVRVNQDDKDVYASISCVADACDKASPDKQDKVEYAVVYSANIGMARLKQPKSWKPYRFK
jgi:hypothetical protein